MHARMTEPLNPVTVMAYARKNMMKAVLTDAFILKNFINRSIKAVEMTICNPEMQSRAISPDLMKSSLVSYERNDLSPVRSAEATA